MPTSSSATYTTASNQIATSSMASGLSYDAAGNVTFDGTNAYLYDAEGRICASENGSGVMTGYIYDGAGIRVAKASITSFSCAFATNGYKITSSYVLGSGGEQVTEYAVSGTTSTWVHTNAFAAGRLLASYHDSDTYFALEDWLGTKRMEITPDGLTATYRSLPYGNGLVASGAAVDATEQHFTGKERDAETGDDYFGARYYASSMGRMMSPDWSAKAEPVPYAKLENPQTLNLYAYVGNNPLSRTDPTGHYVCSGSKDQCAAIQTGLTLAKAAQEKLGSDSKGGKAIGAVLKFYGAAGEKNGVNVSFGNLKGPLGQTSMGANGQINIKFDLKAISAEAKGSMPGTSITERAGTEIHEGTHGIDERAMGHNPENRHEEMGTERNAYRTESYVYQGLGVNTPSGLWSESWSSGTAEQNRNTAVEAGVKASTDYVCKNGCQP